MDIHEAHVAVKFSAICKNRGILYYAHGITYTKNPRGIPMWSIILKDRYVNSNTQAALDQTEIVQWNAPMELIERMIAESRAKGTIF